MPATIYQQPKTMSSVIISLDYRPHQFLSFKVTEAREGEIVWYGNQATALRCQIRGKSYTFDRQHLEIMSQSERNILYSKLGIDGNKLEANLN